MASSPLIPWLGAKGLYGYADRAGTLRLTPRWNDARPFYEGLAAVFVKGDGWGYITTDGAVQIPLRYDAVADFYAGKAVVHKFRAPWLGPIMHWILIPGELTSIEIDRQGIEQSRFVRPETTLDTRITREFCDRYPRPTLDSCGREIGISTSSNKRALRRLGDPRELLVADDLRFIYDAASGSAKFVAGRAFNQPFTVWDLDGKVVAKDYFDVGEFASEGSFVASSPDNGWFAAFDATGRRFTPHLAAYGFIFRDGIAEMSVADVGSVYVDRQGKVFAAPGYLEKIHRTMGRAAY